MDLPRTGAGRFDPSLLRTYTLANSQLTPATTFQYGGLDAPYTRPQVPDDRVGAAHHRGGLYAAGHTTTLHPAGARGPQLWDPAPGWGAGRALLRRPRVLLVLPCQSTAFGAGTEIDTDGCDGRAPALAAALAPLGVAVCVSRSPLAAARPLAAACIARSLSEHLEPFDSTTFPFPVAKLDPVYHDAAALAGGDVMVAELNSCRTQFGGQIGFGLPDWCLGYAFTFLDALYKNPPDPAGTSLRRWDFATNPFHHFSPVTGDPVLYWDVFGRPLIFSFKADADRDRLAAAALAARCRTYRHACYQLDRYSASGASPEDLYAPFDDAGLYAELYGAAAFATRQVVPVDADAVWSRIRADALSFFSA